jgi:hypothetical protein
VGADPGGLEQFPVLRSRTPKLTGLSGEPAQLEAGVMPAVHAKIVREMNTPEDDHAEKPPSPNGDVAPHKPILG